MSRTKHTAYTCGCAWVTDPHGRESWVNLCTAHDAEHRAMHEEAQRDRNESRRLKALEEEFT